MYRRGEGGGEWQRLIVLSFCRMFFSLVWHSVKLNLIYIHLLKYTIFEDPFLVHLHTEIHTFYVTN